ncbi:ATP-binding protein [Adlercreutzia shanghongiae]|uniref:AAA family ATPase n=1 Tax=Adlercreutzia shanghongiae TaxID=3111773 RepID=A0ABU6IZK9_9ACTN|nr:AAA family ATPase [Adlercreutzia sp. R22]MEC4295208.1 AAA family ATPase [Adlercreutzia sp. R22]
MNIREAKQQIKNAMVAYFTKDEFGGYLLPAERQRPVFLLGAPGIGKTAIMEQIAQELEVGFVSYSMTHHTRQSALGLPFIATKTYGGKDYQVSEYTMSEIIASVYEAMETTRRTEGILFLDEINCVSETLTPAMLQFLQYKVFGRHAVPAGWIVVTAGNPPEYNRTARDFDIATWDRLKRIEVEPDYDVWREFAVASEVHPAVITYLDIERGHFYAVEATPDGASFVTARGWDDLSAMIKLYEAQGLAVDELLVEQYVQNADIAKRFAMYYDLFTKYRSDYQIDRILDGTAEVGLAERARRAPFDERVAVMGLVVDATVGVLRHAVMEEKAAAFTHGVLADLKERLAAEGVADAADAAALIRATSTELAHTRDVERASSLLSEERYRSFERAIGLLDEALRTGAELPDGATFDLLRERFNERLDELDASVDAASAALDHVFKFVEDAFGEGQEMLMLVTDLSVSRAGMAFINDHGCERYFAHNQNLQFYERGSDLAARIDRVTLDEE